MGKFARVALRTANIDYNGRLCMVSAGAASKKVFGIDRSANPWTDIPKAKVILVAGANIAECAPITTDYLWQARENGGKLIILDPRMTPIARNADLFIPVRSGGDIGVFNGMLHIMIERGWIDRDFIAQHTTGFDAVMETVKKYTPEYSAKIAGVPAGDDRQGRGDVGACANQLPAARARDRAPQQRAWTTASPPSTWSWPADASAAKAAATP